MISSFRAARRLRGELDRAEQVMKGLIPTGRFRDTRDEMLRLSEVQPATSASKPVFEYTDLRGEKYLFKVAEPELIAAEVCAYEIRALASKPAVPARIASLSIADGTVQRGVLKPLLSIDCSMQLPADTTAWSKLQRAFILTEHVWEWFLSNFDTNTSQYALLPLGNGDNAPLNLDWDRAFRDASLEPPSRFDKYKLTLPNADTFLYADYVEGRTNLPLDLLAGEARRIQRIPGTELRRVLDEFGRARYPQDLEARLKLTEQYLLRQRLVAKHFQAFAKQLVRERAEAAPAMSPQRALVWSWRQWQLVLHGALRGALGNTGRAVLRAVRGTRLLRNR